MTLMVILIRSGETARSYHMRTTLIFQRPLWYFSKLERISTVTVGFKPGHDYSVKILTDLLELDFVLIPSLSEK